MRGFYGILDLDIITAPFIEGAAGAFADAGVPTIQLRAPALDTRALVELCLRVRPIATRQGARFLVSGRPDVAAVVEADGVHLEATDVPAQMARDLLGASALIGMAAPHETAASAAAQAGICDFISFGPIYPDIGLERLAFVCKIVPLPVVAMGGIDETTGRAVLDAGATAVAMISAVLKGNLVGNVNRAVRLLSSPRGEPKESA